MMDFKMLSQSNRPAICSTGFWKKSNRNLPKYANGVGYQISTKKPALQQSYTFSMKVFLSSTGLLTHASMTIGMSA